MTGVSNLRSATFIQIFSRSFQLRARLVVVVIRPPTLFCLKLGSLEWQSSKTGRLLDLTRYCALGSSFKISVALLNRRAILGEICPGSLS